MFGVLLQMIFKEEIETFRKPFEYLQWFESHLDTTGRDRSYREAALRSGLDHYAVNRIFKGTRPGMPACILLADHFEVNPNEIFELAGWPRLKAFDLHIEGAKNLPPESVQVALDLAKIEDDEQRKQVAVVISELLKLFHDG